MIVPTKTLFTIKEVSLREGGITVVVVEYGLPDERPEVVELKVGDSMEVNLLGPEEVENES